MGLPFDLSTAMQAMDTQMNYGPSPKSFFPAPAGDPLPGSVLIADDQPEILEAFRLLLKGEGYGVETVGSPSGVLQALESRIFELLVVDLNYTRDTTSGTEGLDLITRIREVNHEIPILAITAWGTVDVAVEAMRRGASDFIQKPWSNQALVQTVRKMITRYRALRQSQRISEFEVQDAIDVQQHIIPREIPGIPGLDICGGFLPARYVGGDYYNATRIGEHTLALSIADVSGKGVSAALLGASLRTAATALVKQNLFPAALCRALNQTMQELIPEGKFISFFHCVIDTARGLLTYANAGHEAPILLREDGSMIALTLGGAVFGLPQPSDYEQCTIPLEGSDRLVFFTDGIIEAEKDGVEFGRERLAHLASRHRAEDARSFYLKLMDEVTRYCGGEFADDATLIVAVVQ
jgi:sigma-B regulation protein RsbU (phosphoserine phosphatase)